MKRLQILLGIALTGTLLNAGLTASADESIKPGYATVVRVKGNATYSMGDDQWHPLVAGKFLPAGSSIRTSENGIVDLVLGKAVDMPQAKWRPSRITEAPDSPVRGLVSYKPAAEQNVVRMLSSSVLVIDKLTTTDTGADTVSDTELNLKKGGIYASVKKLSPAAQYLVKTPTGIAGVRGTEFSIQLNDDGTIKSVAVYKTHHDEGLVLAITSGGGATQTYMISDGQLWEPGNPNPIALPPGLRSVLSEVFTALRTVYVEVVSFDYDHTRVFESSDLGY